MTLSGINLSSFHQLFFVSLGFITPCNIHRECIHLSFYFKGRIHTFYAVSHLNTVYRLHFEIPQSIAILSLVLNFNAICITFQCLWISNISIIYTRILTNLWLFWEICPCKGELPHPTLYIAVIAQALSLNCLCLFVMQAKWSEVSV